MLVVSPIFCKRILLLPTPFQSHVSYFAHIGKALQSRHGHEIHIVLPNTYPVLDQMPLWGFNITVYNVTVTDIYTYKWTPKFKQKYWLDYINNGTILNLRSDIQKMLAFDPFCITPLSDTNLYQKLSSIHFDLAIIDAIPYVRCMVILPYRLGIPYISLGSQCEPWLSRTPSLPSFVPMQLELSYTETMSFWQRVNNVITSIDYYAWPRSAFLDDGLVEQFARGLPSHTLDYLMGKSLLWLYNTNVVLDYAKPSMPNVIETGGLTTKPGNELEKDLEEFINKGRSGAIVVSFGSFVDILPVYIMQEFVDAFAEFPDYSFIWKHHEGDVPLQNVGSNIKRMTWIPQNDLLASNKTRLFITHCGNNGQFESMYHGVPMVGVPVFSDQPYNAERMKHKGYGLILDITTLTSRDMVRAMKTVLYDPSYRNKIKKASKIFRSQKHPLSRAAYWINHILQFGGAHLHSHALDTPSYQYLMVDILMFIFVTLACLCSCVVFVIYCLRKLFGKC
jgi:hypothetical protein